MPFRASYHSVRLSRRGAPPARDRRGYQALVPVCLLILAGGASGCEACSGSEPRGSGADAGSRVGHLGAEQARQVLARVGGHAITLGDYAAALERMDPFERMRYQTEDRRQALLDEMINVELLAREAERRGLDRLPETIELVRQFQRDELLARQRATLPGPADLPAAEVSAYYQQHRAEFQEVEHRRAAEIVLDDPALARRVLAEARAASPERWRELVERYSPAGVASASDRTSARPPIDLPGDLGFLTELADEPRDDIPAAVRSAVFRVEREGEVYPEPVAHAGRFHVLRLVSVRPARQRTLAEVEEMIRARLVVERQAQARAALLARLRESIAVEIDETALERLPPPSPAAGAAAPSRSDP